MTTAPMILPALRTRTGELLTQLRALADAEGAGGTLLAAISEVEAGGDTGGIKESARRLEATVEQLQTQLRDVLRQIEDSASSRQRDSVGSGGYWLDLQRALHEASGRSEDATISIWLDSFAQAFAAWKLDVCERLTR